MTSVQPSTNSGWQRQPRGTSVLPFVLANVVMADKWLYQLPGQLTAKPCIMSLDSGRVLHPGPTAVHLGTWVRNPPFLFHALLLALPLSLPYRIPVLASHTATSSLLQQKPHPGWHCRQGGQPPAEALELTVPGPGDKRELSLSYVFYSNASPNCLPTPSQTSRLFLSSFPGMHKLGVSRDSFQRRVTPMAISRASILSALLFWMC